MIVFAPNAALPPLVEYNHVHDGKGLFASSPGAKAFEVSDIGLAVKLILAGKIVVLTSTREVNTVLTKLAAIALDAEKRGDKAPKYNLCNVSVKGTNLFCAEGLKTKEYPNGVPRLKMPQLHGGNHEFKQYLKAQGFTATKETVATASLKATQNELIGSKVASMMVSGQRGKGSSRLFISSDNYIVDGHHRWAADVGRDAKDGHLGDATTRIIRVNAPISQLLKIANTYTSVRGFARSAGVAAHK